MAKYRKKPVEIEAWKWNGSSLDDAKAFCEMYGLPAFTIGSRKGVAGLVIPTLEGDHIAQKGDFIIKGIAGEFYPCKPDIFHKTYDAIP